MTPPIEFGSARERRSWAGFVTLATVLCVGGTPRTAALAQSGRPPASAPPRVAFIHRMLRAEDLRGRGPDGLAPLFEGLGSADAGIRRSAVRGLGRQERPELISRIAPLLQDAVVSVRVEATNAIAQSIPRGVTAPVERAAELARFTDSVFRLLRATAIQERAPEVLGMLARSLGRLPFAGPPRARDAEEAIAGIVGRAGEMLPTGSRPRVPAPVLEGAAHGLYALARARRTLGDLTGPSIAVLRSAAAYTGDSAGASSGDAARVRRLAWLALTAAGHRDDLLVRPAVRDGDPQVRRLALLYLSNVTDRYVQRDVLRLARGDPSFLVRLEWVRVYGPLFGMEDCEPLLQALRDANAHVRLAAIGALGGRCQRPEVVVARLRQLLDSSAGATATRRSGATAWHVGAHALLSLARIDSIGVRPLLARAAAHPAWQMRMYVARAAATARDVAILQRLAGDSVGSVREAAIDVLAAVAGRAGDRVYLDALQSPDAHVVRAAARALRGAPRGDAVVAPLLLALARLTAERRETSRDSRAELLNRIEELGDARVAPRLAPYVNDFDAVIAARAAVLVSRWTGQAVAARPDAPPAALLPLGDIATGPPVRLRVTMSMTSGGGAFVLRLIPGEAPATVGRIVELTRTGYYDGLSWHRVAPNFVVQGGSPGMNEYVGDGPFMRDELGTRHHTRGTVGISTRGRDTGDAQLFINLVDNYRLDHDYTVFAEVESGMDVVDGILEGDIIERVELLR